MSKDDGLAPDGRSGSSEQAPAGREPVRVVRKIDYSDGSLAMYSGVLEYELSDGRRVRLDRDFVAHEGLAAALRQVGIDADAGRLPVYRNGRHVGTLPALFEPACLQSLSAFYDYRPGDFTREPDRWIAHPSLGPGDLHAVPGFESDTTPRSPELEAMGAVAKAMQRAACSEAEATQREGEARSQSQHPKE